MSAGDYIHLLSTEITFGKPTLPAKGSEWARIKPVIDPEQPLRAFRDALPVSNRFPVIIYAPPGTDEDTASFLCRAEITRRSSSLHRPQMRGAQRAECLGARRSHPCAHAGTRSSGI